MKVGSIVAWQEPYADDPDIIRSAGLGILIRILQRESPFTKDKYNVFEVYRNKFNDIITLSEFDIESL